MDNRDIVYIRFHSELFVPNSGLSQLGNVLPSPTKKINFHVRTSPWGAVVKIEGHEVLVPWANVQLAKLAPEAPAEAATPPPPKAAA